VNSIKIKKGKSITRVDIGNNEHPYIKFVTIFLILPVSIIPFYLLIAAFKNGPTKNVVQGLEPFAIFGTIMVLAFTLFLIKLYLKSSFHAQIIGITNSKLIIKDILWFFTYKSKNFQIHKINSLKYIPTSNNYLDDRQVFKDLEASGIEPALIESRYLSSKSSISFEYEGKFYSFADNIWEEDALIIIYLIKKAFLSK